MTSSIGQSIEALCSEQGLDRDMVIEAMKDAVKAAARKQFRTQDKTGDNIQVDWNNEEGAIEISLQKTVVEEVENDSAELSLVDAQELAGDEIEIGDMLLIPLPREEMGRIAAQTAKQILVQKVREAIREKVYDEYVDRKGELINGMVKRFERGDLIVDLGNNLEAILPRREQSRGEMWNQGERIRVVITDVSKEQKGQQITVSRGSPELIKRLFEMEVPEIYDETVVIKSAVREPGDRAKIAVTSNERDVDPVGACVGMKGSRVQAIIRELRGEKIDIIEWSDEPSVFAANALSPAKVNQVRITDIENRQMEVIVNEDQLSLAIGKRGQNVRLATKLVGWNIDIRSEEEIKREVTEQMGALIASGEAVPLSAIEGVTPQQTEALAAQAVVALRERSLGEGETEEQHAVSAEFDESMDEEVEPSPESTAAGYDEAVENGVPFQAEADISAWESADPVSLTEAEPIPADEIALQETGRDLRPDTITPSPDITSSGVEAYENIEEVAEEVLAEDEELASAATTKEAETSAPAVSEDAASGGSADDDENQ